MKLLLIIILCLFQLAQSQSNLQLDLVKTTANTVLATITINHAKAQFTVDITSSEVLVCCLPCSTLYERVLSFLKNPLSYFSSYLCASNDSTNHSASSEFTSLGSLKVTFREDSDCSVGTLGLSKSSNLFQSLPLVSRQYLIARKEETGTPGSYQIRIGQLDSGGFSMFATTGDQWALQKIKISFGEVDLGEQRVVFTTVSSSLIIPADAFAYILSTLSTENKCTISTHMYCPCETGLSTVYPSFIFKMNASVSVNISSSAYLRMDGETCELLVASGNHWEVNVLMLEKVNVLLETEGWVGFQGQRSDEVNKQIIRLPIQLILNCLVILLICVFISMLIIEVVKRISGLQNASNDTFESYMLKRHN